ncbi:unannotated protein [freshwater metagenome]|uniref:Unannotated protein n=1 Tax=freshwater metagenome TaxID=449393 RepID=A0A6J6X6C1_9ZZZZ
MHDGAISQHDRKSANDIFDLAVAVGELSGTTTGQPTADGGEIERLGEVANGETTSAQYFFKVWSELAGLHGHSQRLIIDGNDLVHGREIECDAPSNRDGTTNDATASTLGCDGHAVSIRNTQGVRHVLDCLRQHDDTGESWYDALANPTNRQWPPVATVFEANALVGVEGDIGGGQFVENDQRQFGSGELDGEVTLGQLVGHGGGSHYESLNSEAGG